MATKQKLLIPGIIAGAVAIGGIAAYFYLKVIPAQQGTSSVASAEIVPDEAWMAGYIDITSDSWDKLRDFGTPEAQDIVFGGFDAMTADIKESLAKEKLDYDKDIKPWLGSVMFAMVPAAEKVALTPGADKIPEPAEPGMLVVVGIKDKAEALSFANKMRQKDNLEVKETEHKGVKILEVESTGSPSFVAILEHHLAVSNKQDVVKKAIDSSKGDPSLASDGDAKRALEESMKMDNPVAQFFIPDYGQLIEQASAFNPNNPLPPQLRDQLDQIKSVSVGMGIDNDGVRFRAITKVDPNAFKWDFKPIQGKIISQFPDNTLLSANGGNLSQQWQYTVEQLESLPEFKEGLDQVRQQIRSTTQLDLDKDIIGWMDKEVGLALIPGNEGLLQSVGFGGTFVFKTSDRKKAEATFAKFDDLAKQSNVPVNKGKIGNVEVTQWQFPPTKETLVGHGWLDNETVFFAIGDPIIQTMASKPQKTLDQSETFKAVTKSLPQSNSGYFYVNMDEANKVILSNPAIQGQGLITAEAEAIMKSIRGVGIASTQIDKSTYTGDMLLALKPKS
ncbi:DUF3352 domain-containing protein [Acaryochloris sp. IP29b_bin.148]|uniref:DUF3352 domain-containing protein n=1 Tax=Acaryochloris sp. IP29b_bin.148 TaxID=2969218 RepID=UPI00260181BE|nr:DUF3352 domain-containing protein [Acaryochloris sp. IP29b_bin.148]